MKKVKKMFDEIKYDWYEQNSKASFDEEEKLFKDFRKKTVYGVKGR